MSTKLIIVEGLPGAGKSTTAGIVYDILKDKGTNAELFSEGNFNHPADYEGAAYFSEKAFDLLQQAHSENIKLLNRIKVKHHNGYLIFIEKLCRSKKILKNPSQKL